MKEQSAKATPAESESAASEKLKDDQLTAVSGGTATNNNDRLAHLETRTIVQTDKGAEPGQQNDDLPLNAG